MPGSGRRLCPIKLRTKPFTSQGDITPPRPRLLSEINVQARPASAQGWGQEGHRERARLDPSLSLWLHFLSRMVPQASSAEVPESDQGFWFPWHPARI